MNGKQECISRIADELSRLKIGWNYVLTHYRHTPVANYSREELETVLSDLENLKKKPKAVQVVSKVREPKTGPTPPREGTKGDLIMKELHRGWGTKEEIAKRVGCQTSRVEDIIRYLQEIGEPIKRKIVYKTCDRNLTRKEKKK